MSRGARLFRDGVAQPRLVTYATAGDPDLARSADIIRAMARGGADAIEIGVPFSDPIADGPAIQRASERALASGTTLRRTLDLVASVRADVPVPIVLFTYVNPVLASRDAEFLSRAADAGVDGVLLLDLPIEESESMHAALDARGIDQIFLVSPTTTDERLKLAGRYGRGFLYAISRLGVTGARESVARYGRASGRAAARERSSFRSRSGSGSRVLNTCARSRVSRTPRSSAAPSCRWSPTPFETEATPRRASSGSWRGSRGR